MYTYIYISFLFFYISEKYGLIKAALIQPKHVAIAVYLWWSFVYWRILSLVLRIKPTQPIHWKRFIIFATKKQHVSTQYDDYYYEFTFTFYWCEIRILAFLSIQYVR